ncbi:MAG: cell division protein FtsA [Candidatus Handelsmanbacteria bacterium RIFCSPLOWO2_12_FULL_64_10]|uniref:Cell division protein FtsA n=1 Tax=Handelsmanbacteria sp. (strain RIFCSPLOWO2_12_FULL_64_10) TaxID=1817868 RepID=A0A1F6CSM8_HANXR|nr:MAG: cell division protein FtsA [Candidatus Handelsmanbacteria bacterium RIFCSPLOWO2_12_FULL_64_10]
MAKEDMIVGLDIGTTKVCAIVAEVDESGDLRVVGVGTSPSEGLRRGVVVNVEKTVQSIQKAVAEAELMAGVKIESVYVGIGGEHIRSINSRGVIAVSGPDHEITATDQTRVIDAARAVSIPPDRQVIHVLPQEFIVDEQAGIKEPIGMSGVRLEAEVHIVTGAVTSVQNLIKSVSRAGLEVAEPVLEPIAASHAVLSPDEQEMGVALVDIGGGATNLSVFYEGSVRHTAVIGLGGQNVTNDVAIGLRTPWQQAERIKQDYGCALQSEVAAEETITVPGVNGRASYQIPRRELSAIIEPRMEEIFSLVFKEIRRTDYADLLAAGIVLTGGGALLNGASKLAEQVFDMPVNAGLPQGVGGLIDSISAPGYATGVGLVLYGHRVRSRNEQVKIPETPGGLMGWLKNLVTGIF